MALQKARFERIDGPLGPARGLEVQFNPNDFTLTKSVQLAEAEIPGLDAPIIQFVRGKTETTKLELYFDSTEEGTGEGARPVTELTDAFYQLVKIDPETHAPPVCRFVWGGASFPGSHMTDRWASQNRENGLTCVVEQVAQKFTLFNPQGVPLRAVLTVDLREYQTLREQLERLRLSSPDYTHAHVVRQGDTLAGLAHRVYGDPAHWRRIATANDLDDPLELQPGTVLELPPEPAR